MIKDDKLIGACLYGDTVDGSWYFKLLRDGRSIGDIRDKLMFGESTSATPATKATTRPPPCPTTPRSAAATASTRARSARRSRSKGLFTLDEVRKHTKASASLRLVHRPGRADPDGHRRRRLLRRAEEEGPVRLHRRTATRKCATRSASSNC